MQTIFSTAGALARLANGSVPKLDSLSPASRLVLMKIVALIDRATPTLPIYASKENMATSLGLSQPTVYRALRELEKFWIKRVGQGIWDNTGRFKNGDIVLTTDAIAELSSTTKPGRTQKMTDGHIKPCSSPSEKSRCADSSFEGLFSIAALRALTAKAIHIGQDINNVLAYARPYLEKIKPGRGRFGYVLTMLAKGVDYAELLRRSAAPPAKAGEDSKRQAKQQKWKAFADRYHQHWVKGPDGAWWQIDASDATCIVLRRDHHVTPLSLIPDAVVQKLQPVMQPNSRNE